MTTLFCLEYDIRRQSHVSTQQGNQTVDPYIVLSTENKCSETHTGEKLNFSKIYIISGSLKLEYSVDPVLDP
jgi:hypothetical protein